MSKGSSPKHPGTYDGFYDPDFTAEISSKMQVPDRISFTPDSESTGVGFFKHRNMHNENEHLQMHVPDRILLAGGENHFETRNPVPELRFESSLHGPTQPSIQLTNPPHNLTLDNHHYPAIEEDSSTQTPRVVSDRSRSAPYPASNSSSGPFLQYQNGYSYSPPTPPGNQPEDELTLLRRQVRSLTRRVLAIEQETQQLHQREIFFCAGVVLYFAIKGMFWLNRNW